jgi:hypothetical protein
MMIGECGSCRSKDVELVEHKCSVLSMSFDPMDPDPPKRTYRVCKLCSGGGLYGDRYMADSRSDTVMRHISRAANEILKCVRAPTQTVSLDEFQTMFTPRRGPVFTICYDPFVDEDDSPGRVNIEGAD